MPRPDDRRYRESHEWAKQDGENVVVGITDHAIAELTDIVFLDLPETGTEVAAGEEFGEIESVKAVSALYAPVSGTIVEVNIQLVDSLESLKDDAYEGGWMIKIKASDASELDALLDAASYDAKVAN